ncbi:MAG: hypothetical protein M4579_006429 [Chaenotheca gracillima]|nr:MAG: hypothetical protein M4579_006429 [Chaenotheca gracillima]
MEKTPPPSPKAPPFPNDRLDKIAKDACDSALRNVTKYEHARTEAWNSTIINTILKDLVNFPRPPNPQYKFAVNSTIIQHLSPPPTTSSTSTATSSAGAGPLPTATTTGANEASTADETHPTAGGVADERSTIPSTAGAGSAAKGEADMRRRGMHSATGAFWNNVTDRVWSWKYELGQSKGMEVVVSVMFVAC